MAALILIHGTCLASSIDVQSGSCNYLGLASTHKTFSIYILCEQPTPAALLSAQPKIARDSNCACVTQEQA